MSSSTYRSISDFGSNAYSPVNNPLTYAIGYTLDQKFLHGSGSEIFNGQNSKASQRYMAEYCSENWDGFCELASCSKDINYPNQLQGCEMPSEVPCCNMNAGEFLIRNTAAKKYLKSMKNCTQKYVPFDPTVASSPLISYWVSADGCYNNGQCTPIYGVDPSKIDNDPVMNKILAKPPIAFDILLNIYNTAKRDGSLSRLASTKLGRFFQTPYFQKVVTARSKINGALI